MKYLWIIIALMGFVSVVRADTHLSIADLSADGQKVQDMDCHLSKGGMFALMQIVGDLAKQKSSMDACAPEGMAIRLQWNLGGDKKIQTLSSSNPDKNACVVAALSKTSFSDQGHCSAIILVGDAAQAKQKTTQLK